MQSQASDTSRGTPELCVSGRPEAEPRRSSAEGAREAPPRSWRQQRDREKISRDCESVTVALAATGLFLHEIVTRLERVGFTVDPKFFNARMLEGHPRLAAPRLAGEGGGILSKVLNSHGVPARHWENQARSLYAFQTLPNLIRVVPRSYEPLIRLLFCWEFRPTRAALKTFSLSRIWRRCQRQDGRYDRQIISELRTLDDNLTTMIIGLGRQLLAGHDRVAWNRVTAWSNDFRVVLDYLKDSAAGQRSIFLRAARGAPPDDTIAGWVRGEPEGLKSKTDRWARLLLDATRADADRIVDRQHLTLLALRGALAKLPVPLPKSKPAVANSPMPG